MKQEVTSKMSFFLSVHRVYRKPKEAISKELQQEE